MRGDKGVTISLAPNHYEGANSLRGAPNYCGGPEKSKQCHKYFLQYNTFASERLQVRAWEHKTSLPRAPSNLGTHLCCM